MGKHKKSRINPVWERKKNAILRNHRKELLKEKKNPKSHFKHVNNEKSSNQDEKKTFFQQAMSEYERRKAIKDRIKAMKEAKRKEKEEALRQYAEKKKNNFKKLSMKTKWGQPVMRGRIEVLLEKIQKSCAAEQKN